MFELPQAMFAPSTFRSLNAVDDVDTKLNATHLYCHQPHTVQIIQLVECSPPPRRIISAESSYASSSSASSSSSSDEVEESECCSSYCSSAESLEQSSPQLMSDESSTSARADASPETYSLRMKRILSWRENFSSHLSATLSDPSFTPTSLKRKIESNTDLADDAMSHSSKRSRSQSSQGEAASSTCSSLGALSCPACDASFDTRQDLRQHGHDARAGSNEACFVAVAYAFE